MRYYEAMSGMSYLKYLKTVIPSWHVQAVTLSQLSLKDILTHTVSSSEPCWIDIS